jgi:nicotinic acetylcholine receptor
LLIGNLIDLEHINRNNSEMVKNPQIRKDGVSVKLYTVEMGIDMSDYYQSVEWDILSIPAQKNIKFYDCCKEPFYDIYFNITIRRKTLFYTVNLIIPCVNISFLSVLVFYLPSDSGEKLTLGISILVALLVFYLLLIDLIPPTSLVIPLLGKYLLFTLILVNLSILLTIFILNLHHRKPNIHKMPYWMKRVFIDILPKLLMIQRPQISANSLSEKNGLRNLVPCLSSSLYSSSLNENSVDSEKFVYQARKSLSFKSLDSDSLDRNQYPKSINDAFRGIRYISHQMKIESEERKVSPLNLVYLVL